MKVNVENFKMNINTDNNHNRENTQVDACKEDGVIEVAHLEVEIPTEEVLQYLTTAPNVVKDLLAFAKDMRAMQREEKKEESKIVTD